VNRKALKEPVKKKPEFWGSPVVVKDRKVIFWARALIRKESAAVKP
jgi:hypothetical protein